MFKAMILYVGAIILACACIFTIIYFDLEGIKNHDQWHPQR